MVAKLPDAQLTDLVTTIGSEVYGSPSGSMNWATVDICYSSEGLEPKVTIKVPVAAGQSEAQQRAEALRRARKLIDHACLAMETQQMPVGDLAEMLQGLAEELGAKSPSRSARRA